MSSSSLAEDPLKSADVLSLQRNRIREKIQNVMKLRPDSQQVIECASNLDHLVSSGFLKENTLKTRQGFRGKIENEQLACFQRLTYKYKDAWKLKQTVPKP